MRGHERFEPEETCVFAKRAGHAEVMTPAKHAHATRPNDMAVQKFDVMMAIVSSPCTRTGDDV